MHIAEYNGKTVEVTEAKAKEEFRAACYRVAVNIPTGGSGLVHCPNGDIYLITTASRMAKQIASGLAKRKRTR